MLQLSEITLIENLQDELNRYRRENAYKRAYYDGKNRLQDLRISIPPQLTHVKAVVSWARICVDVLSERIQLEGFTSAEDFDLDEIMLENNLITDSTLAHDDALKYGVGYICIGKGASDEPEVLVTVESPDQMVGRYNLRTRRAESALQMIYTSDYEGIGTLMLPDRNVPFAYKDGKYLEAGERDEHELGRLPVAKLINRPRSSSTRGQSEITEGVRSLTNSAMRTLLGAEVAREFYSAPQRWIMGAKTENYKNADGSPIDPFKILMGKVWVDGEGANPGQSPTVGQFSANTPTPYFDQIKLYAQLFAAESSVPESYLGFSSANPTSADAIRAGEARLIKRAERRDEAFSAGWIEAMKIASMIKNNGEVPEGFSAVRPIWKDPATPTRAAAADEVSKLIGAGVLPPDSVITYNRLGLTQTEQAILRQEKEEALSSSLIGQLAAAAGRDPENG